ncbi:conserved hypothetical protein [Sporisorium reilianum SRZ2]|uniref:Uncharacterized protein n=1 Tax=Sporisorium reilianum (strain SRZ2) TaxID=999809 RepID=E6ZNX7_SPORE|nr:conserved hypothetical protein [Sporisorium reilianum SRZ2]
MVVALREQQQTPKKSKLSLFRLGKASTKPAVPASPQSSTSSSSSTLYTADSSSTQQSVPRSSSRNRIVKAACEAEIQRAAAAPIAVHYQLPEASNLPRNDGWVSSQEELDHCGSVEAQYQRVRADSLPLRGFVHPAEHAGAVLEQSGRPGVPALVPGSKHSRQRSHFSIPDVVVTTCEEEGQEQVVELEIPANKRRSYVLRDASEDKQRSSKKSSSAFARRPAPLIRFDADEIKSLGMTRSGSVPSTTTSSGSLASLAEIAAASPPSSSASSSLSRASLTKRSRKPSFPLLFGRRSAPSFAEPLPCSPTTPTSPSSQPDSLLFSSMPAPTRSIFARAISGLPSPPVTPTSPPVTPTSPPRAALRKQMKEKAREELALIKELERVDRMVKLHDDRARREREKVETRERKRAAKLALNGRGSVDTVGSGHGAKGTVFRAARRASVRGGEQRTSADSTHTRAAVATFSIDLPVGEPLPFSNPRVAPLPNVATPPRPTRAAPPVPSQHESRCEGAEVDTSISVDADELVWSRQSFSALSSAGPLPSLIPPSTSVAAIEHSEQGDGIDVETRTARRASVQRVLALQHAAQQQQQQLKRRSSHVDAHDAVSSKRSSAASVRRRIFIRALGDDEGWRVVGANGAEGAACDEWVEDEPQRQDGVDVEVDRVLAALRDAQDAEALRQRRQDIQSEMPPRTSIDDADDKENVAQHVLGKTVQLEHGTRFRLSLALTPLQLQPLDVFADLEHRF